FSLLPVIKLCRRKFKRFPPQRHTETQRKNAAISANRLRFSTLDLGLGTLDAEPSSCAILRASMLLANRVAIVTGASRGIGKGIAMMLAAEGATVAVTYRTNHAAAEKTVKALQALGRRAMALSTDVTDAGRTEQMAEQVLECYGRID